MVATILTIDEVVDECVRLRKIASISSQIYVSAQRKMYTTCWDAVNSWLLGRMKKRQGVDIPNFARITWEYFKTSEGQTRCRPVFLPHDTYCKAYKIKYRPPSSTTTIGPLLPTLAPTEDLHFSKVAIKYSKSLTKDILFVGLRDLFRKMGELMAANGELRIDFSVGSLEVKDKKVEFRFDQMVLKQPDEDILPVSWTRSTPASSRRGSKPSTARSDPPASSRSNPPTSQEPPPMLISSARINYKDPVVLPTASSQLLPATPKEPTDKAVSPPVPEAHAGEPQQGATSSSTEAAEQGGGVVSSSRDSTNLPIIKRLPLEKLGQRPHTTTGVQSNRFPARLLMTTKDAATAEVLKQSYQRYMAKLKTEAEVDDQLQVTMLEICQKHDLKEHKKRIEEAQSKKDLQAYLVKQIELREKEKQLVAAERKLSSATTIPLRPSTNQGRKISREELVRTLSAQIKNKADKVASEKAGRLEEERRYLDHINQELREVCRARQERKRASTDALKATWEMEARFNRCKQIMNKRGGSAVLDYVHSTGLDGVLLTPTAQDKMNRLTVGVGFDSRFE